MADITMCLNDDCKMKYDCFRYTATPSERQSYAGFQPDETGNCEYKIQLDVKRKAEQ